MDNMLILLGQSEIDQINDMSESTESVAALSKQEIEQKMLELSKDISEYKDNLAMINKKIIWWSGAKERNKASYKKKSGLLKILAVAYQDAQEGEE